MLNVVAQTQDKTVDAAWSNYSVSHATFRSSCRTKDQYKMNVKRKDEVDDVGVVEINLQEFAARERREWRWNLLRPRGL